MFRMEGFGESPPDGLQEIRDKLQHKGEAELHEVCKIHAKRSSTEFNWLIESRSAALTCQARGRLLPQQEEGLRAAMLLS